MSSAKFISAYVAFLTAQTVLAALRMRASMLRCTFVLDALAEPARLEILIECEHGTHVRLTQAFKNGTALPTRTARAYTPRSMPIPLLR